MAFSMSTVRLLADSAHLALSLDFRRTLAQCLRKIGAGRQSLPPCKVECDPNVLGL